MFAKFLKDESGATAIEYGILAAFIAVAIITAVTLLGDDLTAVFQNISTQLQGAKTAAPNS
ncbi:Flp family type IVb pilin [Pseudovibrio ascidiaceicola]|uniref:Flp family type IVb pilin n=1 Tax=Pseudovibrio TaxID=258255 RepID=UPI0007AE78F9|nr:MULTISPECIES: Flp family type IVb pilin [unclassified Pseudovibrio]KZK83319.1 Flp/Fap pilin component [Pseudovibrio sp. Ad13]